MQDNFTDDNTEMLIRYMDGGLSEPEAEATENLLRNDAAAREHYQYFLAAKQAIKQQGIKERISRIQQEYVAERKGEPQAPVKLTKRTSVFKTFMRVAAVFIFVFAGYGVYQYTSTTKQSVYDEAYLSYQLPVNRGHEKEVGVNALYNAGNYAAVINAFNANPQKLQKDYFLAALSYLQLNDANAAVTAFRQVERLNAGSDKKYFGQETDYYLALAYIQADKIDEAERQLDKIQSDKQHLFYNKASNISRTKLMMLKWKEK